MKKHKCAKIAIFDNFEMVVAKAKADIPKLELREYDKIKCESFETCEKCAQNDFWEIVIMATADTPNPKLSFCGKFNCKTRETCEKFAHIL